MTTTEPLEYETHPHDDISYLTYISFVLSINSIFKHS